MEELGRVGNRWNMARGGDSQVLAGQPDWSYTGKL